MRRPRGQAISQHLQTLIFNGTLRPGTRLDREQIATEAGTSQIPVREALLRLEAEGAIVIEPHRGAFVAPTTEESVREHWELVGLMVGLVASKVARRHDPRVVAQLTRLVAKLQGVDDPERFNQVARQIGRTLAANGATAKLRTLLRRFGRQVPGNFYQQIPGAMACARSGFERIMAAIVAGDPATVQRVAAEYLREQGDLVVAVLRENGVIPRDPAAPAAGDGKPPR